MQTFNLDLSNKLIQPLLNAKQGDVGRKFRAVITDGGAAYQIPGDVCFTVWYSGTGGEGNYCTVGDKSAFTYDGNTVTIELITQMLNLPGNGRLCLTMDAGDGTNISTWNIPYFVESVPGMGSKEATQYYNILKESAERAAASAQDAANSATAAQQEIEELFGKDNTVLSEGAVAFGGQNVVQGQYGFAEGQDNTVKGYAGHAEGLSTETIGDFAHSEGYMTKAEGVASHAEGGNRSAGNEQLDDVEVRAKTYSIYVENAKDITLQGSLALGVQSHAEGTQALAYGYSSHAEGYHTRAIGDHSHAEGNETRAYGSRTHAEGFSTRACGNNSHAEGTSTEAGGNASHAEGNATNAIGDASHAEGRETKAQGANSHAGGQGTIAKMPNQTVIGRYNADEDDALFIVGNGQDNANRSNAFAVWRDGTIVVGGKSILDLIYPVDSIYMTTDSTVNPVTLFGGVWANVGGHNIPGVYMWQRTS